MEGEMEGRIYGRTDGGMDGRMDGGMERGIVGWVGGGREWREGMEGWMEVKRNGGIGCAPKLSDSSK